MASIYDEAPFPDQIITIRDFIDNLVYYLMRPVEDYTKKITVVTQDIDSKATYRYIINKSALMHFSTHTTSVSSLVVGSTTTKDIYGGDYTGRRTNARDYNGRDKVSDTPANKKVTKIIDPADNTVYEGVDKHVLEGKFPVAGQLISVADLRELFKNCSSKMYEYKITYVSAWKNVAYENHRPENEWPVWNRPGGNGWILNGDNAQWSYVQLKNPRDTVYDITPTSAKFREDELIAIYRLKNMMSKMYVATGDPEVRNLYFLTCHNNCHHNCHCARW